jgi:hypothetical protein
VIDLNDGCELHSKPLVGLFFAAFTENTMKMKTKTQQKQHPEFRFNASTAKSGNWG